MLKFLVYIYSSKLIAKTSLKKITCFPSNPADDKLYQTFRQVILVSSSKCFTITAPPWDQVRHPKKSRFRFICNIGFLHSPAVYQASLLNEFSNSLFPWRILSVTSFYEGDLQLVVTNSTAQYGYTRKRRHVSTSLVNIVWNVEICCNHRSVWLTYLVVNQNDVRQYMNIYVFSDQCHNTQIDKKTSRR